MKIYTNTSLCNFNFWSGAIYTVNNLSSYDLDQIEAILEDLYPDGVEDTFINDFFWFEADTIAEWLGYENWDDLYNQRHPEEEKEEEEKEEEEE